MGLHKIETTCKITDFIQELKSSDKGMKIYFFKKLLSEQEFCKSSNF